jgi:FMN reductase
MSLIVTVTGSPSEGSRTARLAQDVGATLARRGFEVAAVNVRDLPADDLIGARVQSEPIAAALALIERARGVVLCSPVYKASYSGVLKAFLDLLPQTGLAGKVALPLMTGGTIAHVLALDYAFRPVLAALGAHHVVTGLFLLDKTIGVRPEGGIQLEPELRARLDGVLDDFVGSVQRLTRSA